jgi:hypothetical protein
MLGTRPLGIEASAPRVDDSVVEPLGISSSKISRAPRRGAGWLLGVASLAVVAGAFAFLPRATAPKVAAVPPHARSAAVIPPPALPDTMPPRPSGPSASSSTPAALPPSQKTEVVAHARAVPGTAASSGAASSGATPSGATSSAEPEAQFGVLKVTADPRALVDVSGPHFHQAGQSPLFGLKVPVGKYQIVFRNDTFGVPLTAQVMVLSGVSRSVHADFRQAEPAVSVH